MVVDNDGAINRLANFFFELSSCIWLPASNRVDFEHVVGGFDSNCGAPGHYMFVVVVIFHIILPCPKYHRKAATRRRQQRTGNVPWGNYPAAHCTTG